MSNKEFSRYEHKDTITSSDTKVSNSFLEDMKAYVHQYNNEEELRREGAIDFAKWLASDWMSIWVVDKWMWEWQHERTRETFNKYKEYYTEEELYELYIKEQHGNT